MTAGNNLSQHPPDGPVPSARIDAVLADLVSHERDARTPASRQRLAMRAAGVGVWWWVDGKIEWDGDTMCELFGRQNAPRDLPELLESFIHPADRDHVATRLQRIATDGVFDEIDHRVIRADGSVRWIANRGVAALDGAGNLIGLTGVSFDITELKEAEEDLRRERDKASRLARRLELLSNTDGLTGLANRRALDEHFATEWRRSLRSETTMALIIADIDHFKAYNDKWGHLAGDDCLKLIATTLERTCRRAADIVGRYGGEEFLVILPGSDLDTAVALGEALRFAVENLDVGLNGERLTLSCGVAITRPHLGTSPEDLIAAADIALYEAKHSGRNAVRARRVPFIEESETA